MNAAELLSGDEPFVVDTSTWWRARRLPADLAQSLGGAILAGRALMTPIVRIEILYSTRTAAEYMQVDADLSAMRTVRLAAWAAGASHRARAARKPAIAGARVPLRSLRK